MHKINSQDAVKRILEIDPWLQDHQADLEWRVHHYRQKRDQLLSEHMTLSEFANGHHYFGFHRTPDGWVYREWAPAAGHLFLVGDFNHWQPYTHPLNPIGNGTWEIYLPGTDALMHGQGVKVLIQFDGQDHYKLPLYIHYVTQERDPYGNIDWMGRIWAPEKPFEWTAAEKRGKKADAPIIYEAHVGMAQEDEKVSSYREFADRTLPRIKKEGYNTVQLMAIMQHPYYGSFGYHVSNFFAASSWFGTPDDLKYLVNRAHELGLRVLMDLVHSHAVKNTIEGINRFDGTQTQFFCPGDAGLHPAWDSMCFDYGKPEVLHFLLSNLKYWLETFRFDGFRFDGVTSMLYHNHGLGTSFNSYADYFNGNLNIDASTYFMLATTLVKKLRPDALLIAEDVSGMPGLALPISAAGLGFDYRLNMGIPDLWIRNMKRDDHDWDMYELYYTLTNRRPQEKRVSYAESHDQAIVGDKTLFFWLADATAYDHMSKHSDHYLIDRAMSLHKMIRLITITTGSEAYLNFMGNEFGHPEWIDFPRAENNWSFFYCRRQWSLVDNPELKYSYLGDFDRGMLDLVKSNHLLSHSDVQLLFIDQSRKIIAYRRKTMIFIFNFHPTDSYVNLEIPLHEAGSYRTVFSSDRSAYGGYDRIDESIRYAPHRIVNTNFAHAITLYAPARTAIVLERQPDLKPDPELAHALFEEELDDLVDPELIGRDPIEELVRAELIAQEALNGKLK